MNSLPGLLIIVVGLYLMHLGFNAKDWLPVQEPTEGFTNPYRTSTGGDTPKE